MKNIKAFRFIVVNKICHKKTFVISTKNSKYQGNVLLKGCIHLLFNLTLMDKINGLQ